MYKDSKKTYAYKINNNGSVSLEALIIVPIFIAILLIITFSTRFYSVNDCVEEILFEASNDLMYSHDFNNELANLAEKNILFKVYLSKHIDEMIIEDNFNGFVQILPNNKLRTNLDYRFKIPFIKEILIKKSYIISTFRFKKKDYDNTVYITNTGVKYHYKDCIHLRKSSISISIEEAIEKGYTPCKNCIGGMNYFK